MKQNKTKKTKEKKTKQLMHMNIHNEWYDTVFFLKDVHEWHDTVQEHPLTLHNNIHKNYK